ncbi:hypothetical protein [Domibacillus enclensis]|uniref:Stage VI sporulation protein D N-terminal domain-containing protein n=1 Tax=Domibacillus enclensis TaxID=1017273 RepID=A0A1N6Q1Q2_9BACI|nr:hypothetical protein [Domibacillus enclensis]OXS80555.1 hypothetical protein B1B05_03485 [Domibacillus enclensis]SIQ10457.1 hypothetical protein SAMN05443094_101715 [Domibacillus enclensis]
MEELFFISLQEDVVFPEGEEVDELLSISLDPQITIADSVIQGSIEVTGDYRIYTEPGFEEESVRQFFRHIPVQAVLPSNQQASNESDIQIHTFDYTVQKPDHLLLEAELAIAVSAAASEEEEIDPLEVVAHIEEEDSEDVEEDDVNEELEEQEEIEETEETEEVEEAAVQVQKRTEDDPSIFSWLEERPAQQAKWRFQVSSGNVELISTQDEEQPQEE